MLLLNKFRRRKNCKHLSVLVGFAVALTCCETYQGPLEMEADTDSSYSGPTMRSYEQSCSEFNACGGEIEGEWKLVSLCYLQVLDRELVSVDGCAEAVTTHDMEAQGEMVFCNDGSYALQSETWGTIGVQSCGFFVEDCVTVFEEDCSEKKTQSQGHYECASQEECRITGSCGQPTVEPFYHEHRAGNASCRRLSEDRCSCTIALNDRERSENGTFAVSDNTLEISSPFETQVFEFCVEGDELVLRRVNSEEVEQITLIRSDEKEATQ